VDVGIAARLAVVGRLMPVTLGLDFVVPALGLVEVENLETAFTLASPLYPFSGEAEASKLESLLGSFFFLPGRAV